MTLILILIVLFFVFSSGGYWGYRQGYYPVGGYGGGLFAVLVLLIVLYVIFGGAGYPVPPHG